MKVPAGLLLLDKPHYPILFSIMHISLRAFFAVALMAVFGRVGAVIPNLEKTEAAGAAERWVDSVYNSLTERQRVSQLVFPTVNPKAGASGKAVIKKYIQTDACGGLLFSGGSLAEHSDMIAYAQSIARVPLLITFDGEWGLSMRIPDTPRFPKNMALGAITDYRLLYDYGREMARECKLLGVEVNFAPDADVNSNPSNPVIGTRSFGEDPERVAKAVTAYSLGLEDGGVQAVAKHFPGHGDTDVDSHKALPTVTHSRAALDSTDFVPFREFIGGGCSGVMVGHLHVPALDASKAPASLSKKIISGVLRDELGFEGLVYTDALAMKGAVDPAGRNSALAALCAGADVMLNPLNPAKAIDDIMAALKNGKLSKEDVEKHCKRVLRYKYILGLGRDRFTGSVADLGKAINSAESQALIQRLANASVTVVKNNNNILPVGGLADLKTAVINIGARSGNTFMNTCRHYVEVEPHYTINEAFSASSLKKINANGLIIAGIYDDKAATRQCFEQLVKGAAKPVVAVFFINPYKLSKFAEPLKKVSSIVLAYEDIESEQRAAAQALFAGIGVSGRLPVGIKGVAECGAGISYRKSRLGFTSPAAEGMSAWLSDSINAVIGDAIREGAMPGCQVLVARNGNIVYGRAFGRLSSLPTSAKVNAQTAYDLASVSKATGTLGGVMKAYDMGLFKLDDTLGKIIPQITDTAKQCISVRQLLYHETGMPAGLNMYDVMFDRDSYTGKLVTGRRDSKHTVKIYNRAYGNTTAKLRKDILSRTVSERFPIEAAEGIFVGRETYDTIMNRIYEIPLKGRSYRYSCLNFCLLMDIEQRLTGRRHDEFVKSEVFGPLGAYRTGYRPHTSIGAGNVATTEKDTYLRRQTVHGYVHDELAAFSGGVQGNAGLFANADDVAKYCQMLLNGGIYGDARILSEETARLFTTSKSPTCRRGLGFDKPDMDDPDSSPTCEEASGAVFGHLGFTGTVFWVDPSKNLIFVFLTNRVNPTRDSVKFNRLNLRPHLFSLVNRSVEE